MKLKTLSLLAGAIALTLTVAPFAVQAQTTSSSPLLIAEGGGKKGAWESLGLTEKQKADIQVIHRNTRTKIEGILTQEQKDKLKAAFAARQAQRPAGQQGPRQRGQGPWKDLNLTEQQKAQMKQIRDSSKQQIEAILTPEQQAKLKQLHEQARSRRQQRNP
jgi:periplasmic protein CpxP/Spy